MMKTVTEWKKNRELQQWKVSKTRIRSESSKDHTEVLWGEGWSQNKESNNDKECVNNKDRKQRASRNMQLCGMTWIRQCDLDTQLISLLSCKKLQEHGYTLIWFIYFNVKHKNTCTCWRPHVFWPLIVVACFCLFYALIEQLTNLIALKNCHIFRDASKQHCNTHTCLHYHFVSFNCTVRKNGKHT